MHSVFPVRVTTLNSAQPGTEALAARLNPASLFFSPSAPPYDTDRPERILALYLPTPLRQNTPNNLWLHRTLDRDEWGESSWLSMGRGATLALYQTNGHHGVHVHWCKDGPGKNVGEWRTSVPATSRRSPVPPPPSVRACACVFILSPSPAVTTPLRHSRASPSCYSLGTAPPPPLLSPPHRQGAPRAAHSSRS